MMRADTKRGRGVLIERLFDAKHRFPLGETSAVSDAEDVRINREGFGPERCVHNNIGGFTANTGQRLKCITVGGNLTTMIADQQFGEGNDILGLGVEKANRFDVAFQRLFTERNHLCRRLDVFKQQPRCLVNADIG